MSKAITSVTSESGSRLYNSPKTGNSYPSVTTVISKFEDKRWLREWKESTSDSQQQSKHFSSQGTRIHSCIEHFMKSPNRTWDFSKYEQDEKIDAELVEEIKLRSFAFEPFLLRTNLISSEEKIIWERPTSYGGWIGFGGTPDYEGYLPDSSFLKDIDTEETLNFSGFFVADFKNWRKKKSAADCIKPCLQLAAYAAAINANRSVENSIRHGFILGSSVSEVKKIPSLQIFYIDLPKMDFYWSMFFEFLKKYNNLETPVNWSNFKAKAVGYYLEGKDEETGKNIWGKLDENYLPQRLALTQGSEEKTIIDL